MRFVFSFNFDLLYVLVLDELRIILKLMWCRKTRKRMGIISGKGMYLKKKYIYAYGYMCLIRVLIQCEVNVFVGV